jgi:hypothetical protein
MSSDSTFTAKKTRICIPSTILQFQTIHFAIQKRSDFPSLLHTDLYLHPYQLHCKHTRSIGTVDRYVTFSSSYFGSIPLCFLTYLYGLWSTWHAFIVQLHNFSYFTFHFTHFPVALVYSAPHTHPHLTKNYTKGHIYQDFIIKMHYYIVFCQLIIHNFS